MKVKRQHAQAEYIAVLSDDERPLVVATWHPTPDEWIVDARPRPECDGLPMFRVKNYAPAAMEHLVKVLAVGLPSPWARRIDNL